MANHQMNDEYEKVYDKINEMMDQSYGCAESFVFAVGEHLWGGVDDPIRMISTGFSGGVGGTHEELCGGVSGATIIAGLIYGRTTADEALMIRCKRVISTHRDRFIEYFGVTRCQELRDAHFGADERNPCSAIIGPAAVMLIDLLREEEEAAQARAAEQVGLAPAVFVPPLGLYAIEHADIGAVELLAQLGMSELPHQHRAWIGERLAEIGDPRPGVGLLSDGAPDIVWHAVSGGDIDVERAGQFAVERFFLARYPVTMSQFATFLEDAEGFINDAWWQDLDVDPEHRAKAGEQRFGLANNPRDNVSWYDAVAFCRWLTERYRALSENEAYGDSFNEVLRLIQQEDWQIRLPTEWEWQQAATGGKPQNKFPWGAEWEDGRAHTKHNQLNQSMAVGMYPQGKSADCIFDMSGNVWEWCLNPYEDPANLSLAGTNRRVLRGGSWYHWGSYAHTDMRSRYYPDQRYNAGGFRVACARP
jgi:C_GCAxxG_C_C family probable redox protein